MLKADVENDMRKMGRVDMEGGKQLGRALSFSESGSTEDEED